MRALAQPLLSREEYLEREETAVEKHEFLQGEIFAMNGGTFSHAAICGNIYAALKSRLRGKPYQPMNSDMRIHTPSGLDTYPDVSVYCGKPELQDKQCTLLNPVVIIEVLSGSIRNDDRGGKFALYRSLPGLQDYLLVDSEKAGVEHFRRTPENEWLLREYRELSSSIALPAIETELPLAEIYQDVYFDILRDAK